MRILISWVVMAGAALAVDSPAVKTPQWVGQEGAAELPALAATGGWRLVDLNEDGHEDLVVSNAEGYGVYLFNPVEKKNVDWKVGWTQVLREGKPGDANSLPLLVRADGREKGVWFKQGAMWVQNDDTDELADKVKKIPYAELLRVPGPAARGPAESLAALKVAAGWTVSLVAAEPLVQDPIFVDWDERGRMWVVEMGDYPFAPGEQTKDGTVGQGKVSALQGGRIKILTDTDGDGVYDEATVFLDGLLHPTGLAFWRGGVFVANIPDVFYAKDTDGDGVCDERETWFTGFTAGNPQHLVNGFAWGLDGWLYGANGDSGGEITCVKMGGKAVSLGTHDFRFHPDTGAFELEAGRTQYGKWRDDFGNWFGNNNSTVGWHYYLPLRYLERHPQRVAKALRAVVQEDKTVYPIAEAGRRFNWADATNTLTSGCSPMPWNRADGDWLLVCEPQNNLLHRQVLDYTGLPIRSGRHPADAGREFLASTDPWFRPTQARVGPDGALYVVDMHRLVLEHPEWIPAEIARGLDLRAGEDKGRVYRLNEGKTKTLIEPIGNDPAELVARMGSAQRWQRDTAQRLLLEAGDVSVGRYLKALAEKTESLAVRVQAAWTAHLLEGGDAGALIEILQAGFPKVRGAALVAAGSDAIREDELASWFPAERSEMVVAAPVITRVNADRQKVVARYVREVAGLVGQAGRGEGVFAQNCMACHRLGEKGIELGPDLATVAAKPVEQIIEAIFDPNRAVEQRHAATQVTKKDGQVLLGLVAAETPNHLTLRLVGGLELAVARAEIGEVKVLPVSLMPDGLESVLSVQDCADLLARIRGR
jgi:putative membrane-bound dehydrogenase-like protein